MSALVCFLSFLLFFPCILFFSFSSFFPFYTHAHTLTHALLEVFVNDDAGEERNPFHLSPDFFFDEKKTSSRLN